MTPSEDRQHLLIVGAGPAGIAAAVQAAARGLDATLIERGRLAETVARYQKRKLVMAEPDPLPIHEPLAMPFAEGSREDVLEGWADAVERAGVALRAGPEYELVNLEGELGAFRASLRGGDVLDATHVLLGIGVQGNLRTFGVPGEDFPWVTYQLDDPSDYQRKRVVIVGAGDSGIENALALSEHGNLVTIVNRRDQFDRAKPANRTRIESAIADGTIDLLCETTVDCCEEAGVVFNCPGGKQTVPADLLIGRLGGIPPRKFLEELGVTFRSEEMNATPTIGSNYESERPGVYLAGAVIGYPLIKNCMNQGYEVVEHILGNDVLPADELVLRDTFASLNATPAEVISYFQQFVPGMKDLSHVEIRELLFDARVRRFEVDEALFEKNDFSTEAFAIISGSVQVAYSDMDFAQQIGAPTHASEAISIEPLTHGSGRLIGLGAVLSGRRRLETAKALEPTIAIQLTSRATARIVHSSPSADETLSRLVLSGVPLLQILSPEEREVAISQMEIRRFKPGEALFSEGDMPDGVFYIRRGSAAATVLQAGRAQTLEYLQAGRWVGGRALLDPDSPRQRSVTAIGNVEVCFIPTSGFENTATRHPEIRSALWSATLTESITAVERLRTPEQENIDELITETGLHEATDLLVIDESLCIRCDNCEDACAATHLGVSRLDREAGPTFARREGPQVHIPVACQHCENPKCMTDCPPDALRRHVSGEVYIEDNCIGCGKCASNCPYGVIKMVELPDPDRGGWLQRLLGRLRRNGAEDTPQEPHKVAAKCDLCRELPDRWGGGPKAACVASCPTGAISRVDPKRFADDRL